LDHDRLLAGVCGRILPHPDADALTAWDTARDTNGLPERVVTEISNWNLYRSLSPEDLRTFANFHTLSTAIRADVFRRIPFREASFAEDLIWGKDVLEAGYRIQYEPASIAYHSHQYSLIDILRRNFDDGAACRRIVGRILNESDVVPCILHGTREYWDYLEKERGLQGSELAEWQMIAAVRRTAQVFGQWLGSHCEEVEGGLGRMLSITEQIKAGVKTETPECGYARSTG
jgi:rhamnosyltransferase